MRWNRILFAGVGGQGVLSAGRWVGEAAAGRDLPVVVRQVHGMSQRGGSVNTSVVIGGARSPEIPDQAADVLVALEPMEAARVLTKIGPRTVAMVNTCPLLPASLQSSGRPYPPLEELLGPLAEVAEVVLRVDATALAEEAGSHRSLNVVMLGVLAGSNQLGFAGSHVLDVVLAAALPAFREVNRRAFEIGAEVGQRELGVRVGEAEST